MRGHLCLAEAGLLDGRRATTHWQLADAVRARFLKVEVLDDSMLIDEGDLMAAGGVTAWLNLALRIVARFGSPALAARMAKYYLVDTGQGEQRFYRVFTPSFSHGDKEVIASQR